MATRNHPPPPRPLPWPATLLLPHRPPLLLVEALIAREESRGRARALAPTAGLLVEEGRLAPEYFVELVAQTAALGNGYDRALAGRGPGGGMIVGVDGFTWPALASATGAFEVRTEVTMVFATMKVVRGEVYQGRNLVAAGEVKVWEDEALPMPAAADGAAVFDKEQDSVLAVAMADCCRQWRQEMGDGHCRATAEYCFPSDFTGFAGHFPGNPLLPGILQLAAARLAACRLTGRPLLLLSLDKSKFKGMVRPGDEVVLAIDLQEQSGEIRAHFSWKRSDTTAISSGTMRFSS